MTKAKARRAGILYVVFSVFAIVSEVAFPRFFAPGDAAATANNILSAQPAFRTSILLGFATLIMAIIVAAALYDLFKEVDAYYAMMMAGFVFVGAAVALANQANRFAALQFASEQNWLAFGFMRLQRSAQAVPVGFWGLWLFPFGVLVIKSGFIPKIFGYLLFAAGVGYVVTSVTAILFPDLRAAVVRYVGILYFGELPIIFWLAIAGAKEARQPAVARA